MKVDRRVLWQRKKKSLGLCVTCGKNKLKTSNLCSGCTLKTNRYNLRWHKNNRERHLLLMKKWRIKQRKLLKDPK